MIGSKKGTVVNSDSPAKCQVLYFDSLLCTISCGAVDAVDAVTPGGEEEMNRVLTKGDENTILQLIRRGEHIARIAVIVGVPTAVVEKVLEKSVAREMGW